jgi:hypothetical protein
MWVAAGEVLLEVVLGAALGVVVASVFVGFSELLAVVREAAPVTWFPAAVIVG